MILMLAKVWEPAVSEASIRVPSRACFAGEQCQGWAAITGSSAESQGKKLLQQSKSPQGIGWPWA